MKKLVFVLSAVFPLLLLSQYSEAARLGGGKSMGRSYSAPSKAAPTASPTATAPTAAQPRPAWQGLLGGALLGLGLGALLSHLGVGGSFFMMLLAGVLLFVAFGFIKRLLAGNKLATARPATANSAPYGFQKQESGTRHTEAPAIGSGIGDTQTLKASLEQDDAWHLPADFDQVGFLQQAKTRFIDLQSAWDQGDTKQLQNFATDAMYKDLLADLQTRGTNVNRTTVHTINAHMLGIRSDSEQYIAAVKLVGTLDEGQGTAGFSEVWYWVKPLQYGGWLLAGIEQA